MNHIHQHNHIVLQDHDRRRNGTRFGLLGIALFIALIACTLMGGCGQADQATEKNRAYEADLMNKGTLSVLIPTGYPPFSDGDAENRWGYDVAVAQELANRLELQLEFVPATQDAIVETLVCEPAGEGDDEEKPDPQGDIAIAALAITGERDDKIDFSDWYYVGNQAIITLKDAGPAQSASTSSKTSTHASADTTAQHAGNASTSSSASSSSKAAPKTLESTSDFDPETTRIAVVKGSTCEQTAQDLVDEKLVVEYSSTRKCLQALQAKEVQAVVLDLPVATYLLDHEFSDMQIIERVMTGEAYGIAVPSDSTNLKDAINQALADMEADGTLARLQEEYIGSSY